MVVSKLIGTMAHCGNILSLVSECSWILGRKGFPLLLGLPLALYWEGLVADRKHLLNWILLTLHQLPQEGKSWVGSSCLSEVGLSFLPSLVLSDENLSILIGCIGYCFPMSSLFLYWCTFPPIFVFLCNVCWFLPLLHHLLRKSWVSPPCRTLHEQAAPVISIKIMK